MPADTVRITPTLLKKLEACAPQRAIFRTAFPRGITLTPEVSDAIIDRVVASGLDVEWLPRVVLTDAALAEYERVLAPADAEFERVLAPADAEYWRVRDAALAEYERVRAPALAEYERVLAPADAEYWRVSGAAWAEYWRVRDAALAEYERVRAPAEAEYQRVRARAAWVILADRDNWLPEHRGLLG